jgi:hypothetical protein
MQMLGARSFEEIRLWMYRNARPLELARWQYHFEKGDKEHVTLALAAYQNKDGGFGNALEPDNWNPDSSPYCTLIALDVLRELDIYDAGHPMVRGVFSFLDSGKYFSDTGWLFTIPTNSDHPHAPWWTYSEENNRQNGYHAAGGLAGYILRCGDRNSGVYKKALSVGDGMTEKLRREDPLDVHEVGAYCSFVNDIIAAGLADRFDCGYLFERVRALTDGAIERDPAKWPVYSMRPSNYIQSPASAFYAGNEKVVDDELDFIVSSRHAGGVWDISWIWGGYPREFAVSERWWQGFWAVRNLLFLRNFGRLEI